MKLFKVDIETYYFGLFFYSKYVFAKNEEEARKLIRAANFYMRDEDAAIKSISEIEPKEGLIF